MNPNRKRFATPVFAVLIALSGCCTAKTTVLPKGGAQGEVIALSSTSDCCTKKAKSEAEEYCKERNKSLVVTDLKTEYQGADKNLKTALGAASLFIPGKGLNADSPEDYKATMQFKCE